MGPIRPAAAVPEAEAEIAFQHPLTDRDVVERTRELLDPLFVLFNFSKPDEAIYQDIVGSFLQGRCT